LYLGRLRSRLRAISPAHKPFHMLQARHALSWSPQLLWLQQATSGALSKECTEHMIGVISHSIML
jgi:hypothetical protein